jgi:hypothetical protein
MDNTYANIYTTCFSWVMNSHAVFNRTGQMVSNTNGRPTFSLSVSHRVSQLMTLRECLCLRWAITTPISQTFLLELSTKNIQKLWHNVTHWDLAGNPGPVAGSSGDVMAEEDETPTPTTLRQVGFGGVEINFWNVYNVSGGFGSRGCQGECIWGGQLPRISLKSDKNYDFQQKVGKRWSLYTFFLHW